MDTDSPDQSYRERGEMCELWGRKTTDMTREELLEFIGFLDELATDRYYKSLPK